MAKVIELISYPKSTTRTQQKCMHCDVVNEQACCIQLYDGAVGGKSHVFICWSCLNKVLSNPTEV